MGKTQDKTNKTEVTEIPIDKIRAAPWQPRELFEKEKIKALGESLKEKDENIVIELDAGLYYPIPSMVSKKHVEEQIKKAEEKLREKGLKIEGCKKKVIVGCFPYIPELGVVVECPDTDTCPESSK